MVNFPEGVHLLAAEKYLSNTHFGVTRLGLILVLGCVCALIALALSIHFDFAFLSALSSVALCACVVPCILIGFRVEEYHTQFLVQIDNYVPYSVIQKDFRIASTKDNIITLRPNNPIPWDEYTQKED